PARATSPANPARPALPAHAVALFAPTRATRYTPASDTSVLGNRVWVARNKPYGAIINYYLPEATSAEESPRLAIVDTSGRTVRTLTGTNRAGLNRVVWNLTETAACATDQGRGRGGRPSTSSGQVARGRGGDGASWIRALPGDYTVRLTAGGQTSDQPLTVR